MQNRSSRSITRLQRIQRDIPANSCCRVPALQLPAARKEPAEVRRKTLSLHTVPGNIARAEEIALDEGLPRLAIMSGIGVRPYYRRMGYERRGPYMIKDLK
jgi:histone acetyltransferase (RNA polymerase elongator complex component)